jgi:uncharacterized protein (DUF952 family)
MEWSCYLSTGVGEVLYHMCDVEDWNEQIASNGFYVPPTYEQDGFIHATAVPSFLLGVANHFYKDSTGSWICLKIDPNSFAMGKVIYEAAAPVGNKEEYDHSDAGPEPKFPHIYAPIPKAAVIGMNAIKRSEDGSFLSIDGIC